MKMNAPLHSFVDMCVLCVCEAFLFFFAIVWWPLCSEPPLPPTAFVVRHLIMLYQVLSFV